MLFRVLRMVLAAAVFLALWLLNSAPGSSGKAWLRPSGGGPAHVRILRFRASVGALIRGEKAQLCYGVENAKSVRISPMLARPLAPSANNCLEIVPEHTTHYTILAEGFDGTVETRSLTLPVQAEPPGPPRLLQFARRARSGQNS